MSLNQWIAAAVAQKVGAVETAEFFKTRAAKAGRGLSYYLDNAPDREPDPGDELPEGWSRGSSV